VSDREEVRVEVIERVLVVTIDRPHVRNAIDRTTAEALHEHFSAFDADPALDVAVITGADGTFCSGADLHAISDGRGNIVSAEVSRPGPLGVTRMELAKPVIAAVEGPAVAGGLELALWCDLRVGSPSARFGVFCRRFGVPLIDGGTVRLPRLIGASRAMDMILTGREVAPEEAHAIGLANYLTPDETALPRALKLAEDLAAFPQLCLRTDRTSALNQWNLSEEAALAAEVAGGLDVLKAGSARDGAARFAEGKGRHGEF
jgi:enoyl-CoA hydratase